MSRPPEEGLLKKDSSKKESFGAMKRLRGRCAGAGTSKPSKTIERIEVARQLKMAVNPLGGLPHLVKVARRTHAPPLGLPAEESGVTKTRWDVRW
jgi:hypothetical protein